MILLTRRVARAAAVTGVVLVAAGCGPTPPPGPPAHPTTPPTSTQVTEQVGPRPITGVAADTGPGCGERAVAAGRFNPACSEYQGYLDPGAAAGRHPTSGEDQHTYGCRTGYIPPQEC